MTRGKRREDGEARDGRLGGEKERRVEGRGAEKRIIIHFFPILRE